MARPTLLAQSVGFASEAEQLRLALKPLDRMLRVSWLTPVAGRPSLHVQAALPLARFRGLKPTDVIPSDLLELARDHGVAIGLATESATYVAGDDAIRLQLGVATGRPLLRLDRVTHTRDGIPVEWRVIHLVS